MIFILILFNSVFALDSIIQKPTDTPKDMAIKIKADGKTYCYSPYILKGEGYVYISDCNYATPARYDVFHRISWKVNSKWLCMSAPSSVTGIEGKATQDWDYLILRPCVMNDANQRWIINEDSFHTFDKRFKIKHYHWFAYISKNSKDYYDHVIDTQSMKPWIDTIATPPTLAFKTFVGWSYIDPPKFSMYYLQNNASYSDDMKELYYNADNGHIAQYYPDTGAMYCITSMHGKKQEWNWITWETCNDDIPKDRDNKYWEFFELNDNEGALRDRDGNFLRITQYGTHWGVPYTVKSSYLKDDTQNSPKSLFVFSPDIDKWNRYVNAALGDSLYFCPSPGGRDSNYSLNTNKIVKKKRNDNKTNTRKIKRSLPPSFTVSDAWIRRFFEIGSSSDGGVEAIAYCGTCLLQTYQIIAELQENYIRGPIHGGGYFFDTATGTSPFPSFRSRFPNLAERLEGVASFSDIPLRAGETQSTRIRRIAYALALSMLPNYDIYPANDVSSEEDVTDSINTLLRAPVGTIWILNFLRTHGGSGLYGHAQPILRVNEGLMFIPTNTVNFTLEEYTQLLRRHTLSSASNIYNMLTLNRSERVISFLTLQIGGRFDNPTNVYLSNRDCSGLGEDRRGSTAFPSLRTINQCTGGRCTIQ